MIKRCAAIALWIWLSAFGVIPSENLTPPTEASGAGFNTLATNLDGFTGFDLAVNGTDTGHLWYPAFWINPGASGTATTYSAVSNGVVDIYWTTAIAISGGCSTLPGAGGTNGTQLAACKLPIVSTGNAGLTASRGFGRGYYEAVMRVTPDSAGASMAFWLHDIPYGQTCLAEGFPTIPVSPAVPYSEIDTLEHYPDQTTNYWTSYNVNANSSATVWCGASFADLTSSSKQQTLGINFTEFHKYGVLWTSGTLAYYLDDVLQYTVSTTAATEAALHSIQFWAVQECNFSYNDTSCMGGVTRFDVYVQSIRYWSCASWQSNALAC